MDIAIGAQEDVVAVQRVHARSVPDGSSVQVARFAVQVARIYPQTVRLRDKRVNVPAEAVGNSCHEVGMGRGRLIYTVRRDL